MLAGFGPVQVSRGGITRKRKSQPDARSGVGRSYSSHDALGNQGRAKGTGSAEEGEGIGRLEDGVSL